MPTSKKRIYVTLPKNLEDALNTVAERDEIAPATKAMQLIQLGLEISEEDTLDKIARGRDTTDAIYISHEEAWH